MIALSSDCVSSDNVLSWLQISSLIQALDKSMEAFEYKISFMLKEKMENATGQDPTDVIIGKYFRTVIQSYLEKRKHFFF